VSVNTQRFPIDSRLLSPLCSGPAILNAIHSDAEEVLSKSLLLISLLLGVPFCWASTTTYSIPNGIAASTYSSHFTFDGDFLFLMTGGTPNQRGNAFFSFAWTLNADCQDNGYVMAQVTGGSRFYFDSCRQPPSLSDVPFTFGVPEVIHIHLAASVSRGPHSFPNAALGAELSLAGIQYYPASGVGTFQATLTPIADLATFIPEPTTFSLAGMASAALLFAGITGALTSARRRSST
jgi:hypothetical protein